MSHILVWHYPPLVRSQRSNRVRHSSDSQARRALGSRRPHSNRVSTSACDTRLNCIVVMSHILVWHYPPLVRSQRSNRVRHSSDSQARRALGSQRPHSNRVSTSPCDTRPNCIVPSQILQLTWQSVGGTKPSRGVIFSSEAPGTFNMHRSPILAYFFELSGMSGQTFPVSKPLQVNSEES